MFLAVGDLRAFFTTWTRAVFAALVCLVRARSWRSFLAAPLIIGMEESIPDLTSPGQPLPRKRIINCIMERIWGVLSKKQSTVKSAAIVLMVMVFVSRLLGLARDRLLSARFSPDDLGVYFAAFRLPNLVFELLVMGALTAAFIPVFTKYLARGAERDAHHLAATLINLSIIVLLVLITPFFIWC